MSMPFSQGIGNGNLKMEVAKFSNVHLGKQQDQTKTQVKEVGQHH